MLQIACSRVLFWIEYVMQRRWLVLNSRGRETASRKRKLGGKWGSGSPLIQLMTSSHRWQDKTDLSCPCRWCEQTWRQDKTVFSSTHCISRLDKTLSKFSVADSLDLSSILFTPPTQTRQDKTVFVVFRYQQRLVGETLLQSFFALKLSDEALYCHWYLHITLKCNFVNLRVMLEVNGKRIKLRDSRLFATAELLVW